MNRTAIITGVIIGLGVILLVQFWVRAIIQDGILLVFLDWGIVITGIVLEVCGISVLLDWLIEIRRRRRLEPRKQIALRRVFTALGRNWYIELARVNSTDKPFTKEEEKQLTVERKVTPSTNLSLPHYIVRIASVTHHAIDEIEQLIDRFGDLFEPETTNKLFQLTEIGFKLVEDGTFIRDWALTKKDEKEQQQIAEQVNKTFDPIRQLIMKECTKFIVNRIYPLVDSIFQNKIRFYLLNFFVSYFPDVCDIILKGQRMVIDQNQPNDVGNNNIVKKSD